MYKNLKNLQTNTSDLKTADKLIEMHASAGDFLKVEPIYKESHPKDILAFGINLYNAGGLIGTVATCMGGDGKEYTKKYATNLAQKYSLQVKE